MNTQRSQHKQRGASAIEFVLILPLLLLIFWGLVTFATVLQAQMTITRAAEDAARSVSFFSAATEHSKLPDSLLDPCKALSQPSIQCEAMASLANSTLMQGATPADRFLQLKEAAVSINVAQGACGAHPSSLGVEVQIPLEIIRILPPILGFDSWMPTNLTACAVIVL